MQRVNHTGNLVDDTEVLKVDKIIDGTKTWTDAELKSIILFEVPKENNLVNIDDATENANGAS